MGATGGWGVNADDSLRRLRVEIELLIRVRGAAGDEFASQDQRRYAALCHQERELLKKMRPA